MEVVVGKGGDVYFWLGWVDVVVFVEEVFDGDVGVEYNYDFCFGD